MPANVERAWCLRRRSIAWRPSSYPSPFQLPAGSEAGAEPRTVSIVAVRTCGSVDGARGRLLALVRRGEAAAQPLLEGARSCKDKPDDVARRAASVAGDGPLALVEILAAPSATRLRFSIGGIATAGEGASALAADLARAKAAGPLTTVDTTGLRLASAGGGSLTLDLAVLFPKAGDVVRATVTPSGGDGTRAAKSSLLDQAGAPVASDAIVGATLALANRILALYTQDDPMVLQLQGDTVEIRSLQLSGATGTLTLTGRATSRSLAQSLRVGIDAAGADLLKFRRSVPRPSQRTAAGPRSWLPSPAAAAMPPGPPVPPPSRPA